MDNIKNILLSFLANPETALIWIAAIFGLIQFIIWQIGQTRQQIKESFKNE